jgi:uncharacterized protein YdaU (DUF1376 family)
MEIAVHYFKFNIGDYHKKAGRLSMIEHGAYTLLIHACYDREKFPTEEEALDWCWARTDEEVQAVKFVLRKFFEEVDGRFIQTRIQEEIDHYHRIADTNRSIALKREDDRRTNRDRIVNEPPPNQEPINQEPLTSKPILKTSSGNGLLPCPHEEVIGLFHKCLPELPEVRVWNQTRQGYLKARWRELAAEHKWTTQEQGLEWFEKFFMWVRHSKFLMGKVPARPGARPFECELEWLLRPNNWAKLIEGKYHAA